MTFREYLKNNKVYLDGGMGTLLQERGLKPGERPELWASVGRLPAVSADRSGTDVYGSGQPGGEFLVRILYGPVYSGNGSGESVLCACGGHAAVR